MKREIRRSDKAILICVLMLIIIGIAFVYSSSAIIAFKKYNSYTYFLKRQIIWVFIGVILAFILSRMNYMIHKKLAFVYIGISLFLLMIVLLNKLFGSTLVERWIEIGFIHIQPSEISKIAFIIIIAKYIDSFFKRDHNWINKPEFINNLMPIFIITGLMIFLILLQPDFSTAVFYIIILFIILFSIGIRMSFLSFGFLASLPVISVLIMFKEYRLKRLLSFLNPNIDLQGMNYQLKLSILAFANGGLKGQGLGMGMQKLGRLPEVHTDFIFANIGEEAGIIGVSIILILYIILMIRIFYYAVHLEGVFEKVLVVGFGSCIIVQTLLNIAVTIRILPATGITLPFISYGGTSMITFLVMIGIILSITKRAKLR